MAWDTTFARLAIFPTRGAIRAIRARVPEARYRTVLSAVMARLLQEHPDLDAAAASRAAKHATGDTPLAELASSDGTRSKQSSKKTARKKKTRRNSRRTTGAGRKTRSSSTRRPTARKTARKKKKTTARRTRQAR